MSVYPNDTFKEITRLVEVVEADPDHFGALSTGEQIAVALVLNKPEMLPRGYSHVLDAVDRLGNDWLAAAIDVRKSRY